MHRGCVAAPLNTRLTAGELDGYVRRLRPAVVVDAPPAFEGVAPAAAEPASGDVGALVIGTGGTTGVPKAAIFTHEALGRWTLAAIGHQHVRRTAVELSATPFFHGFLVSGLMTTLLAGGTIRLLDRFDPERAVEAIVDHGVTRMSAPPTMLVAMAALLADAGRTADGLRTVLFSSSEPPAGLAERLAEAFPRVELMTGYGTTEFGPTARLYLAEETRTFPHGCVGRPIPGVDVAILREDGSRADPGEQGEVAVYTPWRMREYLENPEETALVSAPGERIRSGDLGVLDAEGLLHLRGRSKDVISSGGENVYPVEVEAVLGRHPAVAAIAVYGAPDPYWGERVEAAVVPRPGASVALDELVAFGREHLAGYKLPKALRTVDELPMTANMKVSRRALREAAAGR